MGLVWCDGFDHYGLTEGNMTDGAYANADGVLSNTIFTTGTHSMSWIEPGGQEDYGIRKVIPTAVDRLGFTARFYFPQLPNASQGLVLADFVPPDAANSHITCIVGSNGQIVFRNDYEFYFNGNVGTIIAETDPILTAEAWQHVEIQIKIHATDGWIRVAVNGVHRYEGTGLATLCENRDENSHMDGLIHSIRHGIAWGGTFDSGVTEMYMDDLIVYDFTGDSAIDTDFCPTTDGSGKATGYIGELLVLYREPDGNTSEDDWLKSTGTSAFALVDDLTPNDADYIYSSAAGDLTELELLDLPPEITYIRGIQLLGRLNKTDSGVARTKFGMNSAGVTDDADERPITTLNTYWWDFMNVDPNSGARWTRTSFDNAKFRITRSL